MASVFFVAVAFSPILVLSAIRRESVAGIVGVSIFAFTLALLYLISTLYHSLARNRAKQVFHVLDHCAIFLLIAGTYTPFTLGVLRGVWGWTLFGVIWGIAVAGIILKAAGGMRFKKLSLALYLIMGWLVIIAVKPLWLNMPAPGLYWLVAGGVVYTAGIGFYAAKRIRYTHFIWHLFVIGGSVCHGVAILKYAI